MAVKQGLLCHLCAENRGAAQSIEGNFACQQDCFA